MRGAPTWLALCIVAGPLGALALLGLSQLASLRIAPIQGPSALLQAVLVAPILEELAFRGFLQESLGKIWRYSVGTGPSLFGVANVLSSLLFSASHLPHHSTLLALGVLFPSLFLGALKEHHGSVFPCVLAHAWFNLCFILIFEA